MSFMFWLIGAALFTSTLGGGLSCGQATFSGGRRLCNISNTAMAFAWINWFAQSYSQTFRAPNLLTGPSSRSRSF